MDGSPGSTIARFAPPGRVPGELLAAQIRNCVDSPLVQVMLDSLDGLVMVLNPQRQILAANPELLHSLARTPETCFGLRPGEAFECIHPPEGPDGCGTSEACRSCGAVGTILEAQKTGQPAGGECLVSIRHEGQWSAREFRVRVTPLDLAGFPLLVVVLHDISDQKRREVLESSFLHDLMNTLQGLTGWTEILRDTAGAPRRAAEHILSLAGQLSQAVQQQRLLLQAEQGHLALDFRPVLPVTVLAALEEQLHLHPAAQGRELRIQWPGPDEAPVWTDSRLLQRVLLNMAVNALEASRPGSRVSLVYSRQEGRPEFRVHNPGEIPPAVAPRVFQRSFSTKAERGRGLGTYAMKVFGENHLGGDVGFRSNAMDGTVFYIRLPRAPAA